MNSGFLTEKLVQRYISDRCTPVERQKVERWMTKDPEREQWIRDVKNIWQLTPEEDFNVNVQEAWERFYHREVNGNGGQASAGNRRALRRAPGRAGYVVRAAAVVALAALAGLFMWYFLLQKNEPEQASFYTMQNLVTRQGEKARVTFSDGTSVILNAASSMRFPKAFKSHRREVYLNGEAYFEVTHNPDRPFIVHTEGADIQDLGTQFNVRAWKEDERVGVTVREGSVAVRAPNTPQSDSSLILEKGQYTSFRKGEKPGPVRRVNIENYLLWINGGLYFDNAPFEQVVRQIERKFDSRIHLENTNLREVPFTGTFKRADLTEILKVISASMGIKYRREGSEIWFGSAKQH